jgi:Na+-driven multidrug efflux pump
MGEDPFLELADFRIMPTNQINNLNKISSRKSILWKSTPLIISELGEGLTMLSGVIFMAIQGEEHLATIGLVDAFLLLCLVFGYALNDGFQNFYARQHARANRADQIKAVLKKSPFEFLKWMMGIAFLVGVVLYAGGFMIENEVYTGFLDALPYLMILVAIYAVGLSLHSFLAGTGRLQLVGILAGFALFMNIAFLYAFLYVLDLPLTPSQTVLLAGICAETGWVATLLWFTYTSPGKLLSNRVHHEKKIVRIIRRASFFPGLSNVVFQIAVLFFFVYFSDCCETSEVALLTVLLSFWTVVMSPVNGICETAVNAFSQLHTQGSNSQTRLLKSSVFQVAVFSSALVATGLLFGSQYFASEIYGRWSLLILVSLTAMLAIRNRIGFVAMVVRLHIRKFVGLKLLYLATFTGAIGIASIISEPKAMSVLAAIILAHLTVAYQMTFQTS